MTFNIKTQSINSEFLSGSESVTDLLNFSITLEFAEILNTQTGLSYLYSTTFNDISGDKISIVWGFKDGDNTLHAQCYNITTTTTIWRAGIVNAYALNIKKLELSSILGVVAIKVNDVNTPYSTASLFNRVSLGQSFSSRENTASSTSDVIFKYLKVNNEEWNFPEGSGSTTTGSEGTVLTLNSTASTDDMWQKVSNGLNQI